MPNRHLRWSNNWKIFLAFAPYLSCYRWFVWLVHLWHAPTCTAMFAVHKARHHSGAWPHSISADRYLNRWVVKCCNYRNFRARLNFVNVVRKTEGRQFISIQELGAHARVCESLWHRPCCTKICTVQKFASAGVRNFYSHEKFFESSAWTGCLACPCRTLSMCVGFRMSVGHAYIASGIMVRVWSFRLTFLKNALSNSATPSRLRKPGLGWSDVLQILWATQWLFVYFIASTLFFKNQPCWWRAEVCIIIL